MLLEIYCLAKRDGAQDSARRSPEAGGWGAQDWTGALAGMDPLP